MSSNRFVAVAAIVGMLLSAARPAAGEDTGTTFTLQGRLTQSGTPVNNSVDVRVRLYDAATGGNQLGPDSRNDDVFVSNGLVTVVVDFGAGAFDGQARYAEIAVRSPHDPTDTQPFVALVQRIRLHAVPESQRSELAGSAQQLDVPAYLKGMDATTAVLTVENNDPQGPAAELRGSVTVDQSNPTGPGVIVRVTDSSNPDAATVYEYDGLGNVVRVTQSNGASTSYVHDVQQAGQGGLYDYRGTATGPVAPILRYRWDGDGSLLDVQQTNPIATSPVTRYTYDGQGSLLEAHQTNPASTADVTRYSYDGMGRLVRAEQTNPASTAYVIDVEQAGQGGWLSYRGTNANSTEPMMRVSYARPAPFYLIDSTSADPSFVAYCDMTTQGGGWTRFTNLGTTSTSTALEGTLNGLGSWSIINVSNPAHASDVFRATYAGSGNVYVSVYQNPAGVGSIWSSDYGGSGDAERRDYSNVAGTGSLCRDVYRGSGVGWSLDYTNGSSSATGWRMSYAGAGSACERLYLNTSGTGSSCRDDYSGLGDCTEILYRNPLGTGSALRIDYAGSSAAWRLSTAASGLDIDCDGNGSADQAIRITTSNGATAIDATATAPGSTGLRVTLADPDDKAIETNASAAIGGTLTSDSVLTNRFITSASFITGSAAVNGVLTSDRIVANTIGVSTLEDAQNSTGGAGQVPTADGNGGWLWLDAAGGGGTDPTFNSVTVTTEGRFGSDPNNPGVRVDGATGTLTSDSVVANRILVSTRLTSDSVVANSFIIASTLDCNGNVRLGDDPNDQITAGVDANGNTILRITPAGTDLTGGAGGLITLRATAGATPVLKADSTSTTLDAASIFRVTLADTTELLYSDPTTLVFSAPDLHFRVATTDAFSAGTSATTLTAPATGQLRLTRGTADVVYADPSTSIFSSPGDLRLRVFTRDAFVANPTLTSLLGGGRLTAASAPGAPLALDVDATSTRIGGGTGGRIVLSAPNLVTLAAPSINVGGSGTTAYSLTTGNGGSVTISAPGGTYSAAADDFTFTAATGGRLRAFGGGGGGGYLTLDDIDASLSAGGGGVGGAVSLTTSGAQISGGAGGSVVLTSANNIVATAGQTLDLSGNGNVAVRAGNGGFVTITVLDNGAISLGDTDDTCTVPGTLHLTGAFVDSNGSSGAGGQVLVSTGTGSVTWQDPQGGGGTDPTFNTVTVTGNTTLGNDPNNDTVTIVAGISQIGDLNVTGNAGFGGNIGITSDASVGGLLHVTGPILAAGGLSDSQGSTGTAGQVLTADGTGAFAWQAAPGGGGTDSTFNTVTVTGNATLGDDPNSDTVTVTATLNQNGNLNVSGNASVADTLTSDSIVSQTIVCSNDFVRASLTVGDPNAPAAEIAAGGSATYNVPLIANASFNVVNNVVTDRLQVSTPQDPITSPIIQATGNSSDPFTPTAIIRNFATGGVAIGTTGNVEVNGDICATGGVGNCSDARLKTNVEDLDDALDIVRRLRGVRFDWRHDEFPERRFSEGRQVGFIAQELADVLPEVVIAGADGFLAVDYGKTTAVLAEAVKELDGRLAGHAAQLDAQQRQLAAQQAQLDAQRVLIEKLADRLARAEAALSANPAGATK